jgi:two-component system CheB/CheR fusion protein
VTAGTVASALAQLALATPDLVISDVHLDGGEDGVRTALLMRERCGRDIPIIVVSGDVSQATRDRVAACGLPMLDKPVAPLRLRTLATRLLRAASPAAAPSSPGA